MLTRCPRGLRLVACAGIVTAGYVLLTIPQLKLPDDNSEVLIITETGVRLASLFTGTPGQQLPLRGGDPRTAFNDGTLVGKIGSLFTLEVVRADHCGSGGQCGGAYMFPEIRECNLSCSLQLYDHY